MTEKEKVHHAINNATNEHLGVLYKSVAGYDPFKRHSLTLPSVVRERTITAIKMMIDKGDLKFQAE